MRYSFGRFSFILLKEIKMETNLTIFKGNKPTINEIIEGEILEESNIALKGKKVTEKEKEKIKAQIEKAERIVRNVKLIYGFAIASLPASVVLFFILIFLDFKDIAFQCSLTLFGVSILVAALLPQILYGKDKIEFANRYCEAKKRKSEDFI
ncbi:hypothetical protein HPMG_01167 [Helicobacter pullorum MIT 98-5489]|uniref:Uncharacterized protein n=2 Tax=Helicobacter pullorum TaxID=35818 RepID=C5F0B6_9HELI|nr:hypothetical protein HPMG_01167 [Helicobacter pullorum MIT 98-5489]